MFCAFSEVSTLRDVSSVAAKQVSKAKRTFSLIAMWLKSTAWISLIKTIEEEVSFCHREYKCDSFFYGTRKVSQKNVAAQEADFVC